MQNQKQQPLPMTDEAGNQEPIRVGYTSDAADAMEEIGGRLARAAHEAAGILAGCLGKGAAMCCGCPA
jgi:hypothetical protein